MEHHTRIDFPGVNGCAICDCGGARFRVGIGADHIGNNHIRCLECVACKHKLAVPFFDNATKPKGGASPSPYDAGVGGWPKLR